MNSIKNITLEGKHEKPIIVDVYYKADDKPKPIVIFCHGYKGFKDWGAWDMMAKIYAGANLFFVKFNFSHNGGTPEQPIDFPDLEAFGQNNYTKELDDLECVLNWVLNDSSYTGNIDKANICLIGHSRGGGIVTIKAEEDKRITKVISLAGVSDYKARMQRLANPKLWETEGVTYIKNGRTQQNMPHYYQFYKDFVENENRLNIQRAVTHLNIPYLIIHGDKDTSVPVEEAKHLNRWCSKSTLELIEGADHVFNTKHPWQSESIPKALKDTISLTLAFIKN